MRRRLERLRVLRLSVPGLLLAGLAALVGVLALAAPAAATHSQFFSTPASPGRDATPTWTFDNTAAWCQLVGPAGEVEKVSCAQTYTAPPLAADGTYTLRISEDKESGLHSASSAYVYDTTPPGRPTVDAPATGNSTTWSFTLTGTESGGTWACTLTGPSTSRSVPCAAGANSVTVTGGDGTYTVSATHTDAAGNPSAAGSDTHVLDTVAPLRPTIAPPPSPGNDVTPTFTLTGEGGGSWSCRLTAPNSSTSTPACAGGAFTPTLAGDGTWTLAVTQTDAAGNPSPAASATYVLDTTAPVAPTVSAPSSPGRDATPSFGFSGESGVGWSCTLTSPGGVTTTPDCSAGSLTPTLDRDGDWTLVVKATDSAGNSSSTTTTYVLDRVAPDAPGIATPSSPSADPSPTFTLTGEGGGTWACTLTAPGQPALTPACGAGALTVSLPGDGTWTLQATQTDAAGNTSAAGTATYVLDRAAPVAPGVGSPATPGKDRTPTFSLTGEDGGTWTCTVTAPDGVTSTVPCAAGDLTLDLTLADEGTHTLVVTQTDAAGNASASTSASYVLDTTAPTPPGVTGPAGPSNDGTPTFALTGEGGASWSCTVARPDGVVYAIACAGGDLTLSLPSIDGTWTLAVTLTDAAGNQSTTTSTTYVLDTTEPGVPGVTGPAGPSNSRAPRFRLTGEPGASFTCSLTAPDGTVSSLACAAGDLTLSLPAVDGTWRLTVRQTDAAGNPGPATSVAYLLDTIGPAPPGLTGPTGPSNDRTPTFTLTGESGGTWACSLRAPDGSVSSVACAAGSLTLSLPALDGTWTLTVTQTDAAGNPGGSSSTSYRLDTRAPTGPGVAGPAGPSNDRSPTFTLTGEAGGSWACSLRAPDGTVSPVACAAGSLTLGLPAVDGAWTLTVTQTDAAGNPSPATTATYLLDTTAPTAPGVSGPGGPSNDRRPGFSLTGEPGGTWACTLRSPDGTTTAPTCAAGDLDLDLAGADGTWTLTVVHTDAAGNASPATVATYLLDTSAPVVPDVSGPTGPSNDRTPTFTLTAEPGAGWACTLTAPDGTAASIACSQGSLTLDLPAIDGMWTLAVTVTDAAGNRSSATTRTYRLDTTAPTGPGVSGPAGPSNDSTPTFTLTGEPGGTWACSLRAPDGTVSSVTCSAGRLTLDLTGPDGTWTLTVTVTDAAGNPSPATRVTYLLDTTAPARPGVAGPAGPSNDRSPTFTLTGEPGGRWSCSLRAPDGVVSSVACAAGDLTPSLPAVDGTWTLVVTVTDAAGNPSPATTVTYLLDTTAPTGPGVSGPAGPSNDRSPTFTLTGEPGGTWSCSLRAPDGTVSSVTCSAGRLTLDLAGPDGSWTLTVVQTDAGGNASGATSATYHLDTRAPSPPGVNGPAGPSNDRSPTSTLTGEPGGTWTCLLRSPDGTSTAPRCAAGALTLDLTGPDGTWVLSVAQTDAAGNTSWSTTVTYRLDTSAPTGPGVSGPAGPSNDRAPAFTLTGEPGGTWSCVLRAPDGTVSSVACAAGSLVLHLTGPDGTWTLTVTQTDAGGSASPATSVGYRLDTTAPGVPGVNGPAGPGNDRTPTFALTGEPGGTWSCSLRAPDGTVSSVACAAGDLTLALPAVDGTWTLTVTQTDAAGNPGRASTVTYRLDTTAPTAPGVTGPAGPSNDRTPTVALTGEPGGTWSCSLRAPDGTVSSVACAAGSLTLGLPALDGTWTLTVTQTDAGGNPSSAVTVAYRLDTTAPTGPGVTGPAGPSNDRAPTFTLTGEPGGTWACTLRAPDGTVTSVACGAGALALDLSGPDGTWTLTVTQLDAAGNPSSATTVTHLLDTTAPAAPGVTGPAGPGNDRAPTFALTGEPGGTWACTLRAPDGSTSTGACGPGTLNVALEGPDGRYTLEVTLTDGAGNRTSTQASYVLDTTPPAAPRLEGNGLTDVQWDVLTEPGTTLRCQVDGPTLLVVACSTDGVALRDSLPVGTWWLVVTAVDEAGNTSEVARVAVTREAPAPAPVPQAVVPAPAVEPPAPEPPALPAPAPSAPAPAVERVPEVVQQVIEQLMVFPSTSQVAGRAVARAVTSLQTFEPRWRDTLRLVNDAAKTGGFPLLLLLLAIVFLAVQDRIDRNDPKLALAPLHGHQELSFRSVFEGGTS